MTIRRRIARRFPRKLPALLCAFLLAACASHRTFDEGRQLIDQGRTEEGLARVEQAVQMQPTNARYRAYLAQHRDRAVTRLLAQAAAAREEGHFDEAELIYRDAARLAPEDRRASAGLDSLRLDRRHAALFDEAQQCFQQEKYDTARSLLRRILAEDPRHRKARLLLRRLEERLAMVTPALPPELKTRLAKPITLEFQNADIRAIFDVLSRSSGVGFIFDRDVRTDLRTSIVVRNVSMEEALKLLLAGNQLDRRVINDSTVMIYPNTPAKQRDYQELVVRAFYLNSADAKQTANLMRSMLKVRDVFVDERINMVVLRDTPEVVRLAEKLVAAQDLPEPEAVLEVEILEVSASRVQSLGLQWPEQISYGLITGTGNQESTYEIPGGTPATGVVNLRARKGLTTYALNPLLVANLRAVDTNANVLANPRIRVKNREKARVLIGDRVPVITSTATATGFVSQSVTYLDVGVKLEVEPVVGLDDEVTMRVGLEVSNIVRQVTTSSGTVAFQVGTRSAGTTLRLRDGETQMLAGLISDEDRRTASKVPGLGDLPMLGRLFSNHDDNRVKTEIVLLITPRVARSITPPEASNLEFTSGTEASIGRFTGGTGGGGGGDIPPPPGPMEMAPPPAPPTQQPGLPGGQAAASILPPPVNANAEAGGTPLLPR